MNATAEKTERWFIAISLNYWGRGRTVDAAKKALKRAGGNLKTYLVYGFNEPAGPDGTITPPWVDDMGSTVSRDIERFGVEAVKNGKPVPFPNH